MAYGLQTLLAAAVLLLSLQCTTVFAKMMTKEQMRVKQQAAMERLAVQPASATAATSGVKNITFTNPKASGTVVIPVSCMVLALLRGDVGLDRGVESIRVKDLEPWTGLGRDSLCAVACDSAMLNRLLSITEMMSTTGTTDL